MGGNIEKRTKAPRHSLLGPDRLQLASDDLSELNENAVLYGEAEIVDNGKRPRSRTKQTENWKLEAIGRRP